MPEDIDRLSDAELAEWHYSHRDELDATEGDAVDVEFGPALSVTMSFRLPGTEADAIREAAQRTGMTLSQWIRHACAGALDTDGRGGGRHEVDAMVSKALEDIGFLQERLKRIQKRNRAIAGRRKTAERGAGKPRATGE